MDKYQEAFKKILKLIVSGKIPKELYNEYLGDTEIGFMSFEELETYFSEPQPPLSECIKEWEERGYEVRVNSIHYLFLINYDKNIKVLFRKFELSYKVEDFYDDEDSCVISYELHNLIHKTLKALEVKE